ncbi:MAG: class I SAM-dependent methyltransferase [Bacteroidia bacterium]|nr:class I SAM-dependent methyltransferase [Bacteroidia bacterium]
MTRDFWNERYGQPAYVYGTEPNVFFRDTLLQLRLVGDILLPAEGEGRNAVFAAQQGLRVTAFDQSEAGRDKALKLAASRGVSLTYLTGTPDELALDGQQFDVIGLIYAHFPADVRARYHRWLVPMLRPGGVLILEAFRKEHVTYRAANPGVGGPGEASMLFSADELRAEFAGLDIIDLQETVVTLNEGDFHRGEGAVIRLIARQPLA